MMHKFKATIDIIGVNPYDYVPEQILKEIFVLAGRDKGYIPVCVVIDKNNHKHKIKSLLLDFMVLFELG